MGGKETLAEKGGVGAVRVAAFAYDTYTNPLKNNGVLGATLTLKEGSILNIRDVAIMNRLRQSTRDVRLTRRFAAAKMSHARTMTLQKSNGGVFKKWKIRIFELQFLISDRLLARSQPGRQPAFQSE